MGEEHEDKIRGALSSSEGTTFPPNGHFMVFIAQICSVQEKIRA